MDYTPSELQAVTYYNAEDELARVKNDWERTRLSTFLIFNSQRNRKSYVSWHKFKKDVFPLETDKDSGKEVSEEQIQNTWTAEDWKNNILNRPATRVNNKNK